MTAPASDTVPDGPRPLVEVTPQMAERMRDPRLVLAIVAMAAGAVALLLGWYGVSGSLDPGVQLSYFISGGLGGIFLVGLGAVLVSSSNMREATRKIDQLQQSVEELSASVAELHRSVDAVATKPAPRRRKSESSS